MSAFHLATASVLGREHARLLRNNQDGVAVRVEGGVAVAVVTDGCGSGGSSEVGARLGARFLAQRVPGLAREHGVGPQLAAHATDALVGWMGQVVAPLDVDGTQLPALVNEQWLFTFLCAVMDGQSALIFGVGDGSWSADGVGRVLDPGEKNAPDYAAYRLVGLPGSAPVVHFFGEALQLAIATDGLARDEGDCGPGALGADGLVWSNPAALQRKLNVRSRELHDDTTVALLKRSA